MNKRIFFTISIALLTALLLTIGSCKKEKESESESIQEYETVSAEDNALADVILSQIDNDINEAYNHEISQASTTKKKSIPKLLPKHDCLEITLTPFDTISWPKELTIDYGNDDCSDNQDNSRSGKIVAIYTGKYDSKNSQITIKLDNYYTNGYKVEGTKVIVNNGINADKHWHYSESVKDALITKPDGKTIKWNQITERKWINEPSVAYISNNSIVKEYLITGTRTGTDSNGNDYNVTIIKPLMVSTDCNWTKSGSINMESDDYDYTITIDYGDGNCDAIATMTILDLSFTFNM